MKNPTTLKKVEAKFGPCLPGQGDPTKTFSALRYAAGKGSKFAGIPGLHPEAKFFVHFPLVVDFSKIKTKGKPDPDFIGDLREDGPQSGQGRRQEVEAWKIKYQADQEKQALAAEKRRLAEEARLKKLEESNKKQAANERLLLLASQSPLMATLVVDSLGKSIPLEIQIIAKKSKKGVSYSIKLPALKPESLL